MRYLSVHGYQVISLHELTERLRTGIPLKGEVVITFDDGYKDNLTEALPVLRQFDFPATIFVTTGLIGKKDAQDFEMLSEQDIQTLSEISIITIAPHTRTHPKLAKLNQEQVEQEELDARRTLEALTGKPCDLFAYPFGNYRNETINITRGLGFSSAVTVNPGSVGSGDDLFTLRRNAIDGATSFIQFKGKLSRVIDRYESLKKLKLWE
jgi:peptidoglycan/xylan/chitin deacetylase (PgdA/CDA1 family)